MWPGSQGAALGQWERPRLWMAILPCLLRPPPGHHVLSVSNQDPTVPLRPTHKGFFFLCPLNWFQKRPRGDVPRLGLGRLTRGGWPRRPGPGASDHSDQTRTSPGRWRAQENVGPHTGMIGKPLAVVGRFCVRRLLFTIWDTWAVLSGPLLNFLHIKNSPWSRQPFRGGL